MNLIGRKALMIFVCLLIFFNETVSAKSSHCVIAANKLQNNFIGSGKNFFFHLSTTIYGEPGILLYVMKYDEVVKDKSEGVFYYLETMTSDCKGWTMFLRNDKGNAIVLSGQILTESWKMIKDEDGQFDAIIYWQPSSDNVFQSFNESIHFKSTSVARADGFDTGISNLTAQQLIDKTTFAVCSRIFEKQGQDYKNTDLFRLCMSNFGGQGYVDKFK